MIERGLNFKQEKEEKEEEKEEAPNTIGKKQSRIPDIKPTFPTRRKLQFDSDTDEGKVARKIVKSVTSSGNLSRPVSGSKTKSIIHYLDDCASDQSEDHELVVPKRNKGKNGKRVGVIHDSD